MPITFIPSPLRGLDESLTGGIESGARLAALKEKIRKSREPEQPDFKERVFRALAARGKLQMGQAGVPEPPSGALEPFGLQESDRPLLNLPQEQLEVAAGLRQPMRAAEEEKLSPIDLLKNAEKVEGVRRGAGVPLINKAFEQLGLPKLSEEEASAAGPIPSTLLKMDALDEDITNWDNADQVGKYLDSSLRELVKNPSYLSLDQNEQERAYNVVVNTVKSQQAIRTAVQTDKGPRTVDQLLVEAAKDKFPDDPQQQITWALERKQDPLTKTLLNEMKPGGSLEGLKLESISLSDGKVGASFKALKPSASEKEKIAELSAQQGQLDDFQKLFDDSGIKFVGPITGRAMLTAFNLGGVGLSPKQSEFMAAEATFMNRIIKLITGAQMSEVEAERILRQVPRVTDTPTQWQAKMDQTRKNVDRLLKTIEEISGAESPSKKQPEPDEINRLRRAAGLPELK